MCDLVDIEKIKRGGDPSWKLGWRREKFEWEKHLEEQLMAMISKVKWNKEGKDRLMWAGND